VPPRPTASLTLSITVEGFDPTKIAPALAGPAGAIVALMLFIAYLMREVASARSDRDRYMSRYEDMRTQRDEFRFLAGDALRAGKRAAQTAVALGADEPAPHRRRAHRGQVDSDEDQE
jgi:hypothetical protein